MPSSPPTPPPGADIDAMKTSPASKAPICLAHNQCSSKPFDEHTYLSNGDNHMNTQRRKGRILCVKEDINDLVQITHLCLKWEQGCCRIEHMLVDRIHVSRIPLFMLQQEVNALVLDCELGFLLRDWRFRHNFKFTKDELQRKYNLKLMPKGSEFTQKMKLWLIDRLIQDPPSGNHIKHNLPSAWRTPYEAWTQFVNWDQCE